MQLTPDLITITVPTKLRDQRAASCGKLCCRPYFITTSTKWIFRGNKMNIRLFIVILNVRLWLQEGEGSSQADELVGVIESQV